MPVYVTFSDSQWVLEFATGTVEGITGAVQEAIRDRRVLRLDYGGRNVLLNLGIQHSASVSDQDPSAGGRHFPRNKFTGWKDLR